MSKTYWTIQSGSGLDSDAINIDLLYDVYEGCLKRGFVELGTDEGDHIYFPTTGSPITWNRHIDHIPPRRRFPFFLGPANADSGTGPVIECVFAQPDDWDTETQGAWAWSSYKDKTLRIVKNVPYAGGVGWIDGGDNDYTITTNDDATHVTCDWGPTHIGDTTNFLVIGEDSSGEITLAKGYFTKCEVTFTVLSHEWTCGKIDTVRSGDRVRLVGGTGYWNAKTQTTTHDNPKVDPNVYTVVRTEQNMTWQEADDLRNPLQPNGSRAGVSIDPVYIKTITISGATFTPSSSTSFVVYEPGDNGNGANLLRWYGNPSNPGLPRDLDIKKIQNYSDGTTAEVSIADTDFWQEVWYHAAGTSSYEYSTCQTDDYWKSLRAVQVAIRDHCGDFIPNGYNPETGEETADYEDYFYIPKYSWLPPTSFPKIFKAKWTYEWTEGSGGAIDPPPDTDWPTYTEDCWNQGPFAPAVDKDGNWGWPRYHPLLITLSYPVCAGVPEQMWSDEFGKWHFGYDGTQTQKWTEGEGDDAKDFFYPFSGTEADLTTNSFTQNHTVVRDDGVTEHYTFEGDAVDKWITIEDLEAESSTSTGSTYGIKVDGVKWDWHQWMGYIFRITGGTGYNPSAGNDYWLGNSDIGFNAPDVLFLDDAVAVDDTTTFEITDGTTVAYSGKVAKRFSVLIDTGKSWTNQMYRGSTLHIGSTDYDIRRSGDIFLCVDWVEGLTLASVAYKIIVPRIDTYIATPGGLTSSIPEQPYYGHHGTWKRRWGTIRHRCPGGAEAGSYTGIGAWWTANNRYRCGREYATGDYARYLGDWLGYDESWIRTDSYDTSDADYWVRLRAQVDDKTVKGFASGGSTEFIQDISAQWDELSGDILYLQDRWAGRQLVVTYANGDVDRRRIDHSTNNCLYPTEALSQTPDEFTQYMIIQLGSWTRNPDKPYEAVYKLISTSSSEYDAEEPAISGPGDTVWVRVENEEPDTCGALSDETITVNDVEHQVWDGEVGFIEPYDYVQPQINLILEMLPYLHWIEWGFGWTWDAATDGPQGESWYYPMGGLYTGKWEDYLDLLVKTTSTPEGGIADPGGGASGQTNQNYGQLYDKDGWPLYNTDGSPMMGTIAEWGGGCGGTKARPEVVINGTVAHLDDHPTPRRGTVDCYVMATWDEIEEIEHMADGYPRYKQVSTFADLGTGVKKDTYHKIASLSASSSSDDGHVIGGVFGSANLDPDDVPAPICAAPDSTHMPTLGHTDYGYKISHMVGILKGWF